MASFLLALSLNTEGTKYAVVILTAPLWIPFLRELWREFNEMLAEEGGLFGRSLSDEELAEVRALQAEKDSALVSELRDQPVAGGGGAGGGAARERRPALAGRRPITRRSARPAGFAAADQRRKKRGGFGPPRH